MKKLIPRTFLGALTFTIGLVGHSLFKPTPKVIYASVYARPVRSSNQFALGFKFGESEARPAPTAKPSRRVSQETAVNMPPLGRVRISAFADPTGRPKFVFTDATSGKELLTEYFAGGGACSNEPGEIRFSVISIKGMPSPLVISIVMYPGGSDSSWACAAAGVVQGKLEELTYERLNTEDEGGFFFGDLGHGIGPGAAQWNFVWGEDESHVSPHQYEVKLFKWNGWRFEWYKVFRTRSKYNSGRAALHAYGLPYTDIRKSFPEWSDIETW